MNAADVLVRYDGRPCRRPPKGQEGPMQQTHHGRQQPECLIKHEAQPSQLSDTTETQNAMNDGNILLSFKYDRSWRAIMRSNNFDKTDGLEIGR
jgi:hypothetical protein